MGNKIINNFIKKKYQEEKSMSNKNIITSAQTDKKFQRLLESDQSFRQFNKKILEKSDVSKLSESSKKALMKVMDNERAWLKNLQEDATLSINVPRIQKIVLPLLRKYWPKLITNDIAQVETLTQPTGVIRLLKYTFQGQENLPGTINDLTKMQSPARSTVITQDGTTTTFTGTLPKVPALKNSMSVIINSTVVQTDQDGQIKPIPGGLTEVQGFVDYRSGTYKIIFGQAPTTDITIDYKIMWEAQESADLPDTEVDWEQFTLEAQNKQLRARWFPQAQEDQKAYDGIDLVKEIYDTNAQLIQQQINAEILADIRNNIPAEQKLKWDRQVPTGTDFYGTRTEWAKDLYLVIKELQSRIQTSTNIAEGNLLVVHPRAEGLLKSQLAEYGFNNVEVLKDDTLQGGYKTNNVSGLLKMFVTPLVEPDKIYMGYKGQDSKTSGYIYAPYQPLTAVPYQTDVGQMGLVFHSRYANKNVRPTWFGSIKIGNMDEVNGLFTLDT